LFRIEKYSGYKEVVGMSKNLKVFWFAVLLVFSVAFAGQGMFEGIEKSSGDFLEKSIIEVEKKAEELTIRFTDEEVAALQQINSDVSTLLQAEHPSKAFLESDLQKKLLSLEQEWMRRDGARIVYKLLESIRIKTQLYIQNAYLLDILKKDSSEYQETSDRMDKYLKGVELSNDTLLQTVHEGRS
jgi:hypothetical protein